MNIKAKESEVDTANFDQSFHSVPGQSYLNLLSNIIKVWFFDMQSHSDVNANIEENKSYMDVTRDADVHPELYYIVK